MLDNYLLFTFGVVVGIVITVAAEVVIIFVLLDNIVSLLKGKEAKKEKKAGEPCTVF